MLTCEQCKKVSKVADCNAYCIKVFNPKTKSYETRGWFWKCGNCNNHNEIDKKMSITDFMSSEILEI